MMLVVSLDDVGKSLACWWVTRVVFVGHLDKSGGWWVTWIILVGDLDDVGG